MLTPVRNEAHIIAQTVAAMRAQRFDGEVEFIFAEGCSTDATRSILRAFAAEDPRVRVIDNPGRSVTSGLNAALGTARGRYVARMDAHAVYAPDYLQLGVDRLRAGGTRWVSGPPVPRGDGPVSRAVSAALSTGLGRSGSRKWSAAASRAPEYDLDAGVFAGVWERSTLLQYGGWDERWRVNEDSELAGRFLEREERLICLPAMAAEYRPRNSLWGLWEQYRVYGEYRICTAVAHPITLRRQHLVAPVLVATALRAAGPRGAGRGPARTALGAYAAAVWRAARTGALLDQRSGEPGRDGPAADPRLVATALATMHFAWGVGTWRGMARFGVPWSALGGLAGRTGKPRASVSSPEVVAPSLGGLGV